MSGLSPSTVESLAPDQASLTAAGKLLKPSKWPVRESDGDFIWAECQGSGANPYRVIFDLRDHGYKCTCPSRKFPCKHVLALALMHAQSSVDFQPGLVPEWGTDWIGRRRKTAQSEQKADEGQKASKNLAAALAAEPEREIDPKKAEAQEAARRKRAAATRAAQIAGLQELEGWVADNLALGLPQVLSDLTARCRTIAARLADAKAASLSGRVDDIPGRVLSLPQPMRLDALVEELGKLVLLTRAARCEPQQAGVQRLISAAESRDDVLEGASDRTHHADWIVLAVHSRSRKDGLVSHATWLVSLDAAPRFALLLDFVPASSGNRGAGFDPGQVFQADIVYFPSKFPLRAVIRERMPSTAEPVWQTPTEAPRAQLAMALGAEPWMQDIPVLLGAGRILRGAGSNLWWCGLDGDCIPIAQESLHPAALGLALPGTAALMRHGRLLLLASQSKLGVLTHDE